MNMLKKLQELNDNITIDTLIGYRMRIWNLNLKELIRKRGYTQSKLADALNEAYHTTNFTQKAINRMLHIGETTVDNNGKLKYKGLKGFPQYETMIKIAEFFDVPIGYLTDECIIIGSKEGVTNALYY